MTAPAHFGDPRLPARFWNKVSPEPNSGCWLWTGAVGTHGYGAFNTGASNGAVISTAHRHAYDRLVAPTHPDLVCDHLCRVRTCCNPGQLEMVSPLENVRRGVCGQVNRERQLGKTHCLRGHELSGRNVVWSGGKRSCRICKNASNVAGKRRKRLRDSTISVDQAIRAVTAEHNAAWERAA